MKSQLEALAKERSDIRLRIIDIGAWDSDVARQNRIRSLPTLWLYDDGELVATHANAVLCRLNALR